MTNDEKIESHVSLLKAETERIFAAQNASKLTSSVIDQDPKIAFMIRGQRSDTDRDGAKLLMIFNKETGCCYIKNYYAIPETEDLSCAICPVETVTLDEDEKIKAALNSFLKSLNPA